MTLTVLGILGDPPVAGRVLEMSGSGLRLKLPLPIPCGAPVKLETGDRLLLGEVVRCEVTERAEYSVAVHLSHSLAALSELARLNRALLGHDFEPLHDTFEPVGRSVGQRHALPFVTCTTLSSLCGDAALRGAAPCAAVVTCTTLSSLCGDAALRGAAPCAAVCDLHDTFEPVRRCR